MAIEAACSEADTVSEGGYRCFSLCFVVGVTEKYETDLTRSLSNKIK